MDAKLILILPLIERRLLNDDITAFKIGKTSNEDERFSNEEYDLYEYASIIACSDNPDLISAAESDMIQYFKSHNTLKGKSENINNGSAGNTKANKLYIIAKGDEPRRFMDVLLDKFPLFEDMPISVLK